MNEASVHDYMIENEEEKKLPTHKSPMGLSYTRAPTLNHARFCNVQSILLGCCCEYENEPLKTIFSNVVQCSICRTLRKYGAVSTRPSSSGPPIVCFVYNSRVRKTFFVLFCLLHTYMLILSLQLLEWHH